MRCIEACPICAQAAGSDCLSEERGSSRRPSASGGLDCADVCTTIAHIISRHADCDADVTRAIA